MNPPRYLVALIAAMLLSIAIPSLAGPITIRDQKGGKVVLVVDDETVRREAGGKPVLVIDGSNIMTEKGGKQLFFIDGDLLHAYKPEGTVVQYKDGRQIRTQPGGKETIYIDGPIVRQPNLKGDPIFWIDNHDVLNNQQLMAAIYVLKPELITMPPDDNGAAAPAPVAVTPSAAAPAAIAAPVAAAASAAGATFAGGTYAIDHYMSTDGSRLEGGKIVITPVGEIFTMEFKLADGQALQGVAVAHDGELWASVGAPSTVGLALYTSAGDTLNGTWYNVTGDSSKFGTETLSGASVIVGPHTITAAKAPFTGASYSGTVTVTKAAGKLGDSAAYALNWDMGGYKASGVGFQSGTTLVAATSSGTSFSVLRLKIDASGDSLTGAGFTSAKSALKYTLKRTTN